MQAARPLRGLDAASRHAGRSAGSGPEPARLTERRVPDMQAPWTVAGLFRHPQTDGAVHALPSLATVAMAECQGPARCGTAGRFLASLPNRSPTSARMQGGPPLGAVLVAGTRESGPRKGTGPHQAGTAPFSLRDEAPAAEMRQRQRRAGPDRTRTASEAMPDRERRGRPGGKDACARGGRAAGDVLDRIASISNPSGAPAAGVRERCDIVTGCAPRRRMPCTRRLGGAA